jgi:hypothetical protein
MALADCRRDPEAVISCAQSASTPAILESRCLLPVDEEGMTEEALFGAPAHSKSKPSTRQSGRP